MTTHEKIVRQALKSVMDQLGKIDALINERPLSGIIDLRIAAQKIITEHKGNYKRIGELIGPLAEEEKRLFSVAKKQEGSTLWDKKFKLQCEMDDLTNELYSIERRRANVRSSHSK